MELGKLQELKIVRFREFGAFLADPESGAGAETVLLPKKQVPEGAKEGDIVRVFLYKDSADRPIATVKEPYVTVGRIAKLRIRDVTKIGAFLDIGLERDVLLPFREREGEIHPGDTVLAALYVDHSGRLAATMRIYPYLKPAEGIERDAEVQGTVYEVSLNDGTVVLFSQNGAWGTIDCKWEAVPASLMPASLTSFVESKFDGAKVVRLDRTNNGYGAALSNGISLNFDNEGQIA